MNLRTTWYDLLSVGQSPRAWVFIAKNPLSSSSRTGSQRTQEATIDEMINIANDSDYGLTASIWCRDEDLAVTGANGVESGAVHINARVSGY
jgi:hypothetical protein